MLRALIVTFVAASFGHETVAQEVLRTPTFSAGPTESADTGPAQDDGILQAGWYDSACDVPCTPVLCEDCNEPCVGNSPIRLRFSIPGWLPEVHGTSTVRGVEGQVNVTTRKLFEAVDDLDFVFSGRLEASAGRWGILADGLYVNLSGNRSFVGDRFDVSAGLENAIVDSVITYELQDSVDDDTALSTQLLAGTRYWLIGSDGVSVTGPRGRTVSTSGTRDWVDPIVGGRIAAPLTEDLLMRVRADIGGFGASSDFTWNIEAVGEYRCSECCGLQLGYRVLDVDYSSGDGFAYDVNYRGPIATLVFDF